MKARSTTGYALCSRAESSIANVWLTNIDYKGVGGPRHVAWVLDHMRAVPDHRIPGMVSYPLDEVLLVTLVGVVCGADDWEGVEEVATGALYWLRGFLPFGNGVATAQTLRKVFRLLDPQALQRGFAGWAASLRAEAREVIAVDGKTLRGRRRCPTGRARCIWFRLTPPRRGWCSPSAPSRGSPTRSGRSRNSWTCSTSRGSKSSSRLKRRASAVPYPTFIVY